jgi:hypothetical protein
VQELEEMPQLSLKCSLLSVNEVPV